MAHTIKPSLTNQDIEKIQASVVQALDENQHKLEPQVLHLLENIVDVLNNLRLTVEFDHEQRLKAIEEFLSEM
jgi:hypothetical protein